MEGWETLQLLGGDIVYRVKRNVMVRKARQELGQAKSGHS